MTNDQFWQIIETAHRKAAGDPWEQGAIVGVALEELSEDEILSFDQILQGMLQRAYTFDLMMASFIILSHTSEDIFEDFRAWLILQGRNRFENAVQWPDTIAQFLRRSDVLRINGESLLMAPATAYEHVTGKDDFYDRVGDIPDPVVVQDWPDTRARFRRRFPALYDAYWNQEMVMKLNRQTGEDSHQFKDEE
jgi:hypothetical protein